MKKRTVVLAGAVGIAGGLGYLLTRKNGQKPVEAEASDDNGKGASMRRQSAEDKRIDSHQESAPQMEAMESSERHEVLDDRGTDQAEASQILCQVRDGAFEGSDEKLALALGRPPEEIEQWTHGAGDIDGDVVLKARALANLRGLELGSETRA
jgi:hypothetical protein